MTTPSTLDALLALGARASVVRSRDGRTVERPHGLRHARTLQPRGAAAIKADRKHRARPRKVTAR